MHLAEEAEAEQRQRGADRILFHVITVKGFNSKGKEVSPAFTIKGTIGEIKNSKPVRLIGSNIQMDWPNRELF